MFGKVSDISHLKTHLFEVSAKQNRCIYCIVPAPRAHTGFPLFLLTHLSFLFTHLWGNYVPPLIPTQPHALSKTTSIPQCTCIPPVSNSPTMPSVSWPTTPQVPVRAHRCHFFTFSICFLPWLTHTLFILEVRTQFKSPFAISHTPHNCFLLIFWSVLFTTHQGTITH